MNSRDFVRETNRIENIHREPTQAEVDEFERFMRLDVVTIGELEQFVSVYQPDAKLRILPGMNVYVGRHVPPPGGPAIPEMLQALLDFVNDNEGGQAAYSAHIQYETIHPFTDGNGRSGRMLWAWQIGYDWAVQLGFLHRFYYQTLDAVRVLGRRTHE